MENIHEIGSFQRNPLQRFRDDGSAITAMRQMSIILVKFAFLKRIQNEGIDVWKQVSYFELKKLYIAKERKKPEQKIQQKDLITMMKEAYKDDYNIGSLDE